MDDLAIARAVHVAAVVIWIGGVAMVTTILLPLARKFSGGAKLFEAAERRLPPGLISRARCRPRKRSGGHLFGVINTRDKFVDQRRRLAEHEWARLQANNSLECRNCHSAESMDITKQAPRAAQMHETYLFTGEKTCVDCHKGIAHRLPDMTGVPGWQ